MQKTITSELGNVSPVVVIPGHYTEKELSGVAEGIAGMLFNNASFNSSDSPANESNLSRASRLSVPSRCVPHCAYWLS